MKRYKNLSGKSGVKSFDIGTDYIRVRFHDGSIYLYTYQSAGRDNVEQMKRLATSGEGLSTFIDAVIKVGYASKLRKTKMA